LVRNIGRGHFIYLNPSEQVKKNSKTSFLDIQPLNLHMLIHLHCYLFDFVLFYCFQVSNKDVIYSIDFGLKAHFEKI
jgi:hypothetical protein